VSLTLTIEGANMLVKMSKLVIQLFGMVIKAENVQVSNIPVSAVIAFLAILPAMALLIFI